MIDVSICSEPMYASPLLATLRGYHAAAAAEAGNDETPVELSALLADHLHHPEVLAALRREHAARVA